MTAWRSTTSCAGCGCLGSHLCCLPHRNTLCCHPLSWSPQAWLRQLRSEAPPRLSPFSLALSFTLAGIQRFEMPVTGEKPRDAQGA